MPETPEISFDLAVHTVELVLEQCGARGNGPVVLRRYLDAAEAEISRLRSELEKAREDTARTARNRDMWMGQCQRQAEALTELRIAAVAVRLTARVLLQNAEGCAANHYGEDMSIHGPPGWIADSEDAIVKLELVLASSPPAPEQKD